MKKLLLTGFEPFLSNPINPTMDIIKALDGQVFGQFEVIGRVLSVDFKKGPEQFKKLLSDIQPEMIVSLGLAAGITKISPERVAINIKDGEKDNNGVAFEDGPIYEGGDVAYFSTLPIRSIVNRLHAAGYPATISNSAGTYLCNNIMYEGLRYANSIPNVISGFIHIPASFDLAIANGRIPGWSSRDLLESIKMCLEECVNK
jgi:pyroglutamyl-peptidase